MREGEVMTTWTRERIIRDIVRRDAEGLPLSLSINKHGIEPIMYQAASRIFGSWKNAVVAAGLPVSRARAQIEWTPARIRKVIRSLSNRKQPLSTRELTDRYGHFLTAARRYFGSWSKAVIASGIDPQRMRRTPAWSKERVIEGILTLALRNESLQRRFVQPRAFVEAGTRLFGSWKAALAAAGVELPIPKPPNQTDNCPPIGPAGLSVVSSILAESVGAHHRPHTLWKDCQILDAVKDRMRRSQLLYATAVYNENRALYRAATRRFGNWKNTLVAAGLEPQTYRKSANTADHRWQSEKDSPPSHQLNPCEQPGALR